MKRKKSFARVNVWIIMKKLLIEYYSNNSGGSDWLDEKQWKALKKAGWRLFGFRDFIFDNRGQYALDKKGLPKRKKPQIDKDTKYAFKRFDSIDEAIKEFEKLTGEDSDVEGCECCGKPHCFRHYSQV